MRPVEPVLPSHPYLRGPVYAENQPQYNPLPCLKSKTSNAVVTTRWHAGFWDRLRILLTGDVWLQVWSFDHPDHPRPLSPVKLMAEEPTIAECER